MPSTVAFISKFVPGKQGQVPLMPSIIGTGFLVSELGIAVTNRHVAEVLQQLPSHPETGEDGYGAVMFDMGKEADDQPYMCWMMPPIESVGILNSFTSDSEWYGEARPDVAFVQFGIRETPFLKLATTDFYLRPGISIATAGFPMGNLPLTVMGKVNQVTPFIRRGIVSSVYPFSIPRPHGFTIDIMQQGGSSGSPIFYEDDPTVVGMMASGILQPVQVNVGSVPVIARVPTNVSIAVASHMISHAFTSYLGSEYFLDPTRFPTMAEWQVNHELSDRLNWTEVKPPVERPREQ